MIKLYKIKSDKNTTLNKDGSFDSDPLGFLDFNSEEHYSAKSLEEAKLKCDELGFTVVGVGTYIEYLSQLTDNNVFILIQTIVEDSDFFEVYKGNFLSVSELIDVLSSLDGGTMTGVNKVVLDKLNKSINIS